ncbi:MAG: thiamine-phosphate kinase [Flavobacteriaceae bacterium]|nr:thiamine-phosphate kinase [Flavobacteriaceae bacterium]
MKNKKSNKTFTKLSEIGEFELISKLTKNVKLYNNSTVFGIGDDSAILDFGKKNVLVSSDMLVEGVHFDLSYMPLKHLGYKAIISNLSDIYSMNSQCSQVLVNLGVSNRFNLEAIEEVYFGINSACKNYGVDLVGGDTTSSNKGLIISVTAIGSKDSKSIVKRNGAKVNDLLVVSGDLGGAFLGLKILEREKEVFKVNPNNQPDLTNYKYVIQRQLRPEARKDVIDFLSSSKIIPTSMIDISDGLSSEILHISKTSNVGINLYENKIPMSDEMKLVCDEFNLNPTTIALSGGEDYELLFTIDQSSYDKIKNNPGLTIIGHVTEKKAGTNLINSMDQKIEIKSQGWNSF